MSPVKVLHLIKSLGRGGAEMLLPETMAAHSGAYQFDVAYFLPHKNQMVEAITAQGSRVFCLAARSNLAMFRQIPALVRLIKHGQYQIVHAHLPWAGIVGRLACSLAGVPLVYTEHNNFDTYHWLTRWLSQVTYHRQQAVITVSHEAERVLRRFVSGRTPITTIENGINTDKFSQAPDPDLRACRRDKGIPEDAFVVSTVAVFRPQKRLGRWLDIAEKIAARIPNVHFVLIGDGVDKPTIDAAARNLLSRHRLSMPGLIEHPKEWLACTDVFLMSSDFEGMPLALLEAMSMGCVPVVTPVGGITRVVRDKQNGLVYAPQETEEAAARIVALLQNEAQRQQLSEAARHTIIEHFSINRMVRDIESVYSAVLKAHHGHPSRHR